MSESEGLASAIHTVEAVDGTVTSQSGEGSQAKPEAPHDAATTATTPRDNTVHTAPQPAVSNESSSDESASAPNATPTVHPTDAQLGAQLLDQQAVFCLACNTMMLAHQQTPYVCICDPQCCGWHRADVRKVAASYRRFDIPPGNVPVTVWVIPGTGKVPGIIHRKPS